MELGAADEELFGKRGSSSGLGTVRPRAPLHVDDSFLGTVRPRVMAESFLGTVRLQDRPHEDDSHTLSPHLCRIV